MVTQALRRAIERGELLPGEELGQAELAGELGVSRIPLRDAFRRLASEGLIELDGRRTARVAALSIDDIAEIYEMRILLETACIRHAVAQMGAEDVDRILDLSRRMDEASDDPVAGRAVRLDFYAELYALAGRPRMRDAIVRLRAQVDRYHVLNPGGADSGPGTGHAHTALREAIRDRDPDRAAEVLAAHLAEARDDLVRTMREAV